MKSKSLRRISGCVLRRQGILSSITKSVSVDFPALTMFEAFSRSLELMSRSRWEYQTWHFCEKFLKLCVCREGIYVVSMHGNSSIEWFSWPIFIIIIKIYNSVRHPWHQYWYFVVMCPMRILVITVILHVTLQLMTMTRVITKVLYYFFVYRVHMVQLKEQMVESRSQRIWSSGQMILMRSLNSSAII